MKEVDKGMMNVLIVDGHGTLRCLLAELLCAAGYQVQKAANGQQALERISNYRFDAVLMDIYMPFVDPWETCQKMRHMSQVPILTFSTFDSPLIRQQAWASGADACFAKPLRPEQIFSWLSTLGQTPSQATESPPYRLERGACEGRANIPDSHIYTYAAQT